MGKPTICICKTKGADQLQRLCFRYSDSTIPLLLKSEISSFYLALFCACTDRFVSDLFGNHIVGFPTSRLIFNCHLLSNEAGLQYNINYSPPPLLITLRELLKISPISVKFFNSIKGGGKC